MSTKTQTDKVSIDSCDRSGSDEKGASDQRGDPWRLRCPNGHTSWEHTPDGYRCLTGKRFDQSCAEFDRLVDAKTGEAVTR